jgi:hypothetical protein
MSVTQQGPAAFASSTAGTPAVSATGTNGAAGVQASSDRSVGVFGQSDSDSGVGVQGTCDSGAGVFGFSTSGIGIHGLSDSSFGVRGTSGNDNGVFGESESGNGVSGSSNSGDGVHGLSNSRVGVRGESFSGTGILGTSKSGFAGQFNGNVKVNGNLEVHGGTKPFVQAHPTDPDKEIVYIALEGGEAGTYVRGSGQLQSGKAVLALPEHFGLVTESSGLTVQLTPRGEWLQLYVVELDMAQLVVREAQGKSGTFDYLIQGVRRGYEQHEVIRTKR